MTTQRVLWMLAGLVLLGCAVAGAGPTAAPTAEQTDWKPTHKADGVVQVPAFELPPSAFMSPEAVEALKARAGMTIEPFAGASIEEMRENMERYLAPTVDAAKQRYPVDIAPREIASVRTHVITPKDGEANPQRVLINLHGGAFMMCAHACAMLESIPIAAVGRFRVVTVDYRQGPEHTFPAATQDVVAVYQDLLETYRPENVGIYGCSAGGALTAQVQAWLQREELPSPGALGIFGAGATRLGAGDSAHIAARIDGSFPPPRPEGERATRPYFRGVSMDDPLVSPAHYPDVLAKFPPTLLITGTRAMDLSAATYTHSELMKAGGRGNLIVGEGMGHCYINNVELPESRDAYDIITTFFDRHLGVEPR
jgi:acetyl esterase/lipase